MRRLGTQFLNHPSRDNSVGTTTAPTRPVTTVIASALLSALLAALLAACGNGGGAETLNGAPSNPATPAVPSGLAAPALSSDAAQLVLRAYSGYWAAEVQAMSTGQADGSDLSTYATGAALSDSYADVVRLVTNGLLMSGAPHNSPRVTGVGPLPGAADESQATLVDCLDVSGWHQVNAKGGQVNEPAKRLTRYPVVVTARTVGGVWMISQIARETGKSC
ncbi:hypothetical protein [Streptacidiphilus sp. MAP12-20]|uniref:hypothetical protein n=1 Tax=Streptacidiphilus sp. MAP12-20 TaxID=3156299 RepID=UPI00351375A1